MTVSNGVAQVYRAAATIIETKGWGHGENVGVNGERCLGAAVNEADQRSHWSPSDDLFRPLAGWLVANREAEVLSAYEIANVGPTSMAQVLMPAREFPEGLALRVVQMWNDARVSARTPGSPTPPAARSKDEVISVLREAADHLASAE